MNLTLILRDVPVKDDAAYNLLYSLCPRKIIYSVDFGVLSFPHGEDHTTRNFKRLNQKLDALKLIVPFNDASEIAPMFPSYWFSKSLDEDIRGYAAGEAFRLFADVKTVYFDLGVQVNIEPAKEMAEMVHRLNPDVGIGVIAPLMEYEKLSDLYEWVLGTTNMFACPFLPGTDGVSLLPPLLDQVHVSFGNEAEVFVSHISEVDANHIKEIAEASPLQALVFWSALAAKDVKLPLKGSCEEEKPVDPYVEMKALFTSMIRDRKSTTDAEVIGHVGVGDSVRVHVYSPNGEGTTFGKVELADGKHGYVVVSHFKQQKFAEVETQKS